MVTVTSRVQPLTDYLLALFTGAATLGVATPPVTIYDGPATTLQDSGLALFVGWTDPDSSTGEPAAESQQTWGALGRLGRNEQVTIHCCAQAWSGSDVVAVTRLACTGITAAVETLMQADATQFGGNVLFPDPGITGMALSQNVTAAGAIARQQFDLVFKCRIGG